MQDIHFLIGFKWICMHRHMFWKDRFGAFWRLTNTEISKKKSWPPSPLHSWGEKIYFLYFFIQTQKRQAQRSCRKNVVFWVNFQKIIDFLCFRVGPSIVEVIFLVEPLPFFCGCWSVMYAVCIRFPLFDKGNGYVHQHDFHWPVNRFAMIWRIV